MRGVRTKRNRESEIVHQTQVITPSSYCKPVNISGNLTLYLHDILTAILYCMSLVMFCMGLIKEICISNYLMWQFLRYQTNQPSLKNINNHFFRKNN